jgi:hypothetical protein
MDNFIVYALAAILIIFVIWYMWPVSEYEIMSELAAMNAELADETEKNRVEVDLLRAKIAEINESSELENKEEVDDLVTLMEAEVVQVEEQGLELEIMSAENTEASSGAGVDVVTEFMTDGEQKDIVVTSIGVDIPAVTIKEEVAVKQPAPILATTSIQHSQTTARTLSDSNIRSTALQPEPAIQPDVRNITATSHTQATSSDNSASDRAAAGQARAMEARAGRIEKLRKKLRKSEDKLLKLKNERDSKLKKLQTTEDPKKKKKLSAELRRDDKTAHLEEVRSRIEGKRLRAEMHPMSPKPERVNTRKANRIKAVKLIKSKFKEKLNAIKNKSQKSKNVLKTIVDRLAADGKADIPGLIKYMEENSVVE